MMAHRSIGVQEYGVSLNLHTNCPELTAAVAQLLPGLWGDPVPSPDLVVHARWLDGPCDRDMSYFPDAPQQRMHSPSEKEPHPQTLNEVGKRMQIGQDELIWLKMQRDKDLQLRFRQQDGIPRFDVAYCYQPTKRKLAKYPDFKAKKYFDLARYLVHFPVAWHLERTRGWSLIHAAAVSVGDGDESILIAGPSGVGKSTLALALAAQPGVKLLTENQLFCDGTYVYPVIEPVRLTQDSIALLGGRLDGLALVEHDCGLKDKRMFWPEAGLGKRPSRPIALFMPEFSEAGFVQPLAAGIANERIRATNRLTLELNNYDWYTAALDLLWPQPGNAQAKLNGLRSLTENMPCYRLGVDRDAGIDAVVEQIFTRV